MIRGLKQTLAYPLCKLGIHLGETDLSYGSPGSKAPSGTRYRWLREHRCSAFKRHVKEMEKRDKLAEAVIYQPIVTPLDVVMMELLHHRLIRLDEGMARATPKGNYLRFKHRKQSQRLDEIQTRHLRALIETEKNAGE